MSSARSATTSPSSSLTPSFRATCASARRRALGGPSFITIRVARAPTPTSSSPRRWQRVAERERGIGRGLAAILAVAPRDEAEELRELPVELIETNPKQPRRAFDEQALLALAESIRSRGVLQPVLVRPLVGGRYELIAGERRWRAARLAERDMVPAVVRRHDDAESLELALIENMAREDPNPVEEARACAALVEELGLT